MRRFFFLIALLLTQLAGFSQSVGIGTTIPEVTAQLDISSNSKGILIPRLTKAQRTAIVGPATGLLVYQTDVDSSFFIYNGAEWTKVLQANSGWSLNGNLNTSSNHFIGTLDKRPVLFKMNSGYAGKIDTSGSISFGRESLSNNAPARINTAFGDSSLFNNSIGVTVNNQAMNNTAMGAKTLKSNTIGYDNTATGGSSLSSNTSGFSNTAFGFRSMQSNTTGFWNTASGWQSLSSNSTGIGNTGFGYQALNFTSTANYNTAVGYQSLLFNTTGFSNTAIGVRALFRNTDINNLVAVGDSALYNNGVGAFETLHGQDNHGIGSKAMYNNTLGYWNTAIGFLSMFSNINGDANTAVGHRSLYYNTSGQSNTASGLSALFFNTTGSKNTAYGCLALADASTGSGNTGIGYSTMYADFSGLFTGSNNTAIGHNAGKNAWTGSNNTYLGYNAEVDVANASNQVRIGDQNVTLATIKIPWTTSSDSRYKEQVRTIPLGLAFITRLRPVDYIRIDNKKENNGAYPGTIEAGFIAQEVAEVLKELGYEHSGMISKDDKGYYGMRYNDLFAPIVKSIQDLHQQLLDQKKNNMELKNQNEALLKRLEALEKRMPGN